MPSDNSGLILPPPQEEETSFDFSPTAAPCQYFKSTYARSLSFSNSRATKSLEIDVNFGLHEIDLDCSFSPSTSSCISAARSLLYDPESDTSAASVPESESKRTNRRESGTQQEPTSPTVVVVTPDLDTSSDGEVLRLRKECQSLIEEKRRLIGSSENVIFEGDSNGKGSVSSSSSDAIPRFVENVFLQTQIDTLNWKLKQVEASREMYRAVMDEVGRFLQKCYQSLDGIHTTTHLGRSKSVLHVPKHLDLDCSSDCGVHFSPRARSSTNLVEKAILNSSPEAPTTPHAPTNTRTHTWSRSPHRVENAAEFEPEKLSQEAFRLLRTVQNLMNTREPSLQPVQPSKLEAEPVFRRKVESPDVRSSTRSSTDESSRFSSSSDAVSSKHETDEDHPPLLPAKDPPAAPAFAIDDESGFSSMNSFQDIGLPLVNSTMRSNTSSASSIGSNESTEQTMEATTIEKSPECTVIAKEKVGIPRVHRRWDSAPVTPRLQLSRDVSSQVLWV